MAGPVYTRVMNERINDLRMLDPKNFQFERDNVGYQAGAGLDIGKLSFDLRYQGSITEMNKRFDQRSSLYHTSIGYKLL
jgi:hypothetical protein